MAAALAGKRLIHFPGRGFFLNIMLFAEEVVALREFATDMAVIITITHDENPVAPIRPCIVIMAGNQMG